MKYLIFLFVLFLSIFSVSANYYADISINVNEDGGVSVNGKTDFSGLQNITNSQLYTYKNKEYWILNISFDDVFDYYLFELTLPQSSQINYIKTTPDIRFEDSNDRLKVIGVGENRKFNLVVQYKITNYVIDEQNSSVAIMIIIVLLITIMTWLYLLFKNNPLNKKEMILPEEDPINNVVDISDVLPERQKDILKILRDNNGKISQKELENKMEIPKSSISRNVKTLESKGLISKERIGQINYIILKKL